MRAAVLALVLVLAAAAPAAAVQTRVDQTGAVRFAEDGRNLFDEGRLGFRYAGQWFDVTGRRSVRSTGGITTASLTTAANADISLRAEPVGEGMLRVEVTAPSLADGVRAAFDSAPGERFLGFGERSDAVARLGGSVFNRVTEGPYQPEESPFVSGFVPPAGQNDRPDATYFPIPWLLSTRGPGLLIRNNERSAFRLGSPWSLEVYDTRRLVFEVYAGRRPAEALRRFTKRIGRQPRAAAPFYFGPWWQPTDDPVADLRTLRDAGAMGSLVQTYTHYLPCGDQNTQAERTRTGIYHAAGLAVTTYFNPMVCTSYERRYRPAEEAGALTRDRFGNPYLYRYTGSDQFLVGQYDFTNPEGRRQYYDALDEAVQDGYDGWMEDFGEYTPDDAYASDGTTGHAAHNLYPVLYHATARLFARSQRKPLARFNRSGWTGAAQFSQIVWGGDPSTSWGFDGLQSAVRNGLSMGLSGVSLWGSDIGGFFALSKKQTTPDLLRRWIQFGFASGVMRTQANGYDLGNAGRRAQITDPEVLPTWTRYAKLRTQFYPYLAAAQRTYDRTGMPIMRHLSLAYPEDPEAVAREDQYLFGPDILVAPVLEPDAAGRSVYLPRGQWVDFWRSVSIAEDGSIQLERPVIYAGQQEIAVPGDDLPMFVRRGSVLTLLPADVQTLAPYGKGSTVRLADRAGRRTILAWSDRAVVEQERSRRLDVQMAYANRVCRRSLRMRSGVIRACRRAR
jgi:sulfoquinovosidase